MATRSGIIPKIVAYLSLLCWSHALRSDQHILIAVVLVSLVPLIVLLLEMLWEREMARQE
jgi:uncharacterized membrane protein YdjX (TVP38/TMEM64 family)